MKSLIPLIAAALSSSVLAAAPLKVEVFTASPDGFLVTSTIVSGEKEAIVIDAQFTLSEAHRLTAKLLESGKTLKAVYVTHAHPDHFFGVEVLKTQFPKAKILASREVVQELKAITPGKHGYWKPIVGQNLTAKPVIPSVHEGKTLELEGQTLELISLGSAESEASTVVWIPSSRTLIAGDLVYEGVHAWLADASTPARREAWLARLETLKALKPDVVIAGHRTADATGEAKVLDAQAAYLRDFSDAARASKSASELVQRIAAKHPLQLPIILDVASAAVFPGAK